eukprot:TRINITY_DN66621_c0_g1_i1.p3 TRINITY_DN66621_c0_g1~~TRINITY_DN66621_c0_g1_i1.p3  ORF type:complete len:134 (+),score=25.34 TRINITY_DN66621_c0_g1_i1:280-681(+)
MIFDCRGWNGAPGCTKSAESLAETHQPAVSLEMIRARERHREPSASAAPGGAVAAGAENRGGWRVADCASAWKHAYELLEVRQQPRVSLKLVCFSWRSDGEVQAELQMLMMVIAAALRLRPQLRPAPVRVAKA